MTTTIPAGRKTDTLITVVNGRSRAVVVHYENVTDTHITMSVQNEADALLACYCHRYAKGSEISFSDRWLVTIAK